ncbi:MAG: alpha/beta fold hydrolase [Verrucomicrobiota bacterium]|nr:alpha/beta fold hydrolase [Verrucomicrobiota bacterium]
MSAAHASQLPSDIRFEYPYASNNLTLSNGTKMNFVDEGAGPVVLMLHGNPTWSFYYRDLIRQLSASGYRCIAPDHIGCGLSDKPKDYNYTLAQRIEDIESLIDHLGISQFSMILHDWGGAIGCGVAGRKPDAIEKLVLLNTGAFLTKRIPLRIAAIKLPYFGEVIIRGLNGFAGPATNMAVKIPLNPAVKRGMLWPYRSWADRVAIWNFVKDIPLYKKLPSYDTLAEVQAGLAKLVDKPVQLIWGAKDFCFNLHFHSRFQTFFPKAQSVIYSKFGHYILEDAGKDSWLKIEYFLNEET